MSNNVCRIALADGIDPYVVPMNYGYGDGSLYLHSAPEGRKIEIIKQNGRACFEVSDSIEIIPGNAACEFGTRYRSVIGFGNIQIVESIDKKRGALEIIMAHCYAEKDWNFLENMVRRVVVLELRIESMSGKKSGF